MEWTPFTITEVLAVMPPALVPLYNQWILDYPEREDRLKQITDNLRNEVRDAIITNPANRLHEDATYIPQSLLRTAETLVFHALLMDMDVEMTSEAIQLATRADFTIRQIRYKNFSTRDTDDAVYTPLYGAPDTQPERALP
jgi:hypothetical protein